MKKIICLITVLALLFCGCTENLFTENVNEQSDGISEDYSRGESDVSKETLERAESEVKEDGIYLTPASVAAYIHVFGRLPNNYITKREAVKLGWDSKENNLGEVARGKSIGGDRFGNYEKKLPKGSYRECDVNYHGGARGAERLVYSDSGEIYYTPDHYKSFTRLY